jgi:thioredoxin 1
MANLKHITDNDYENEVIKSDTLTIVDFWAPWCGPCQIIAPELEKLADEYGEQLKIVKVNVDENPVHAQQNGITGIPTLLFYKSGDIVDRVVGAESRSALKERIDRHTN